MFSLHRLRSENYCTFSVFFMSCHFLTKILDMIKFKWAVGEMLFAMKQKQVYFWDANDSAVD